MSVHKCVHEFTFSDGITEFCEDCGRSVAYLDADTDEWVKGEVSSDQVGSDDGWRWR